MKCFVILVVALLLSAFSFADTAKMPKEFYKVPRAIREQATMVVSGLYEKGMYPFHTPNGSDGGHEWIQRQGFMVQDSYRGNLGSSKKAYVAIGSELPYEKYVPKYCKLKEKHLYLVLIKPRQESLEAIDKGDSALSFNYMLTNEEVLGIIDLKADTPSDGGN